MPPVQSPICRPRFVPLVGLFFIAMATGCSSLEIDGVLPTQNRDETALAEAPVSTCVVELHTGRRAKSVEVPLSAETRVQDVLDASRATSKFRHLDVTILRPTSNAAEPMLKLPCQFDASSRKIGWQTDYALLPGDRVIVREDTTSPLDRAIGSFLGPVFGSR